MVIEALAKNGWGARRFALNFMEENLTDRPWCICEVATSSGVSTRLYLPALSSTFRQAAAQDRLLWMCTGEAQAPQLVQTILESGLCAGVLLHGLEKFPKSQPAGLWGRRWQLSAQKGDTHLLWIHEQAQALIGFDVRIEWTAKETYEIKRGHGYFHEQRLKKTLFTQRPAA
jgi:hypothetical protein